MSNPITYRLFQESDLAGVLRMWEEESEWGKLTPEMWRQWYREMPGGDALIVLGIDAKSDEVVSQFVFIPALVHVRGQDVQAMRPRAPIMSERARSLQGANVLNHPVLKMFLFGIQAMKERGYRLVYMLPHQRWKAMLRMYPGFQLGSFPLWSLKVPLIQPLAANGYSARRLAKDALMCIEGPLSRLWQKAAGLYGCQLVLDLRTLCWKAQDPKFHVLAIEQAGELVGLVTSKNMVQDKQWLICDLMAADDGESLRATFAAVANLAHEQAIGASPEKPINKIAILVTPLMEPSLRSLGFTRDDYNFTLAVLPLDDALAKTVDPSCWYVSAGD